MDFKIFFCADGIMRAKFSEDKPMLPLKFIQDQHDFKSDLDFWVRWWESATYFEAGLTVGKFLSCLEPWKDFWSTMTGKDISAYISESRRPLLIKEDEEKTKLDWVGIFYYTQADPDTKFEKDDLDEMFLDINAWFNKPKSMCLTGTWNIHSSYKVSGFVQGVKEQYSVDYTPMNELANVPLILSDKQILHFGDWQLKRILEQQETSLFAKNAFGVCKILDEKDNSVVMNFLQGEKVHKLRDVIEGFFWWMYKTPARRQEFLDELNTISAEVQSELDSTNDKVEQSNIISLADHKKESNKEKQPIQDNSAEVKKLKVKVAPDAFSPMVKKFERDEQYWEEMLDAASKDNDVVIKIGKAQIALEPEQRVFSYIVSQDDINANPQPSPYKLV